MVDSPALLRGKICLNQHAEDRFRIGTCITTHLLPDSFYNICPSHTLLILIFCVAKIAIFSQKKVLPQKKIQKYDIFITFSIQFKCTI